MRQIVLVYDVRELIFLVLEKVFQLILENKNNISFLNGN